jgi:hypothetical protein
MSATHSVPRSVTIVHWQRTAAVFLGLAGIELAGYGGLLPSPGAIAVHGWSMFGFGVTLLTLLGLVCISAAAGVWRGRAWGRAVALPITLIILAYHLWWRLQWAGPPADRMDSVAGLIPALVVPLACSAFIIFVLTRRWTRAGLP